MLSEIERFDTGTPIGYLKAAIAITMRRPDIGEELAEYVSSWTTGPLSAATTDRPGVVTTSAVGPRQEVRRKRLCSSTTSPNSSTSN